MIHSNHTRRNADDPDRHLPAGCCDDSRDCNRDSTSKARAELMPSRSSASGVAWLVGGFLFCPCHLPITLWVVGTLVAGTSLETALRANVIWVAVVITLIWLGATIRGFQLLRRRERQ
jgi:hypothetical protein